MGSASGSFFRFALGFSVFIAVFFAVTFAVQKSAAMQGITNKNTQAAAALSQMLQH